MNLRDECLPWRNIIGEVILDVSFFVFFSFSSLLFVHLFLFFISFPFFLFLFSFSDFSLLILIFLKKNKTISTVVNKTGEIDTVFRTFKMELLAGKEDYNSEVV